MWNHDEFLAKATLYFGRSTTDVKDDTNLSASSSLWLLLGLEFLLRAPLARIHPTLLAHPEGKSILHAAGFPRPDISPRSITTKTVVDRLLHIEPKFGEDRGKAALFLADLRNSELHTSEATLENLPAGTWMPKFLDVVEAVCEHLGVVLNDVLPDDVSEHAAAERARSDQALRSIVKKKIEAAKAFYGLLKTHEVVARLNEIAPASPPASRLIRRVACPACGENSAIIHYGPGRRSRSEYNEEDATITYSVTRLAESLACAVCDLKLPTTGEIIAAKLDRLYVEEFEEDRYEGWEESVSYDEAIRRLGLDEPEHGNE